MKKMLPRAGRESEGGHEGAWVRTDGAGKAVKGDSEMSSE